MTAFTSDIAQWLRTWLLFITYGSQNLGYLSGDIDNSLEPHTISLYFPMFGYTNSEDSSDLTDHYIELKSSVKNINFVLIVNLTALNLDMVDDRFQILWKYSTRTVPVNFKLNEYRQLILDYHFHKFTNENKLNHELYFNVLNGQSKILYVIFHAAYHSEIIGRHQFTVIDLKTTNSYITIMINVKDKNISNKLNEHKIICNGNIHFCSLIYMADTNTICQRDDTSALNGTIGLWGNISSQKSANQYLLVALSSLFAVSLCFVIGLVGYHARKLGKIISRRTALRAAQLSFPQCHQLHWPRNLSIEFYFSFYLVNTAEKSDS
uniref:Uncharacterized protein n=1 Tax=Trichobilharzia regenti TaxID=157069 RepID=A0AA85JUZ3_TRIRE|nr:unnamed protein product [Trichobilharzia regenti]